ncbi:ATP-binding protein [Streptomyces sp. TS71-3]|uniref:ATP-binding protein n=1 Tax=Streptomyces sp. TS71-3 TaxID=2733862 RepID=UPI001B29DC9A|nr:ATP-binding protein [Streptomyces sp. TS71-3]GHJ36594.1 ATP-binding protein [Streptomyces sp. TS71-3]
MTSREFTQRFSSTPLGARLARHLVVHQLHTWGIPHGTEASDTAALIVAELAANAATHGRVPGRDFEVRVTLTAEAGAVGAERGGTLTVEVSDTRGECRPPDPAGLAAPAPLGHGGRGLFLVAACASRWSVRDRAPGPGKTVVAELDLKA